MALDLYVIGFDQVDGAQVHQIAFVGGYELTRGDFVQVRLHVLAGFPGFQGTVVSQVYLQHMAVTFQEQDLGDFFHPDASAHQPEDHLGAVPLADVGNGTVHGLGELGLGKGLQEIIRGFHLKSFHGKFVAGGEKNDFRPAVVVPELPGHIGAQNPGHAHIQQHNIEQGPLVHRFHKGKSVFKGLAAHIFFAVLEVFLCSFPDLLDLVLLIITNGNMQHAVHFLSMGLYQFTHLYYTQSGQSWKISALKGRFFFMKRRLKCL